MRGIESTGPGTLSLLVDLQSGKVSRMGELTLASAGLRERQDLQQWITAHPDLIAPDLLLVTTEFDLWQVRDQKVADRLDALFLDSSGAPVVVEFKRDKATDTVELQALKYAAYCSQLTLDELVEEFARARGIAQDEGRDQLLDHAPSLEDGGLRSVKIRLVAGSFGPAVTSVVLWLREYNVDIGCIEVSVREVPDASQVVVSTRQLLPLPEAEDYLVRRRRKEQEEERAREEPVEWTWEGYAEQFPAEQVAVARRLFDDITRYVQEHALEWTPVLRAWWLGYQRAGGYYVPIILLHRENPVEFAVKLPETPERLGLSNPYPALRSWWHAASRQWTWAVPSLADLPNVGIAIDLSRPFQPPRGPMPRAQEPVPGPDVLPSDANPATAVNLSSS